MLKLLLFSACALFSGQLMAQANPSKLKPLYFPADKNQLQVLPQRFEYTLMDEEKLKIGDILIDFNQVFFQVEPSSKKGFYKINFSWPSDLMNEGQIAIKNNSGKAILSKKIVKGEVVSSQPEQAQASSGLRSATATTSLNVEASVVNDMQYYPFMVLCIYRERENTKIYLCSKELYLANEQGQPQIKTRSGSSRKKAQVEINGKIVGNQGIIYLNNRSENVAFRADTQSGAFLEIETRKKDVDFKDIVVSDDGDKIILTASGTEPVDINRTQKISSNDWQISIPKNRPVVYLKGDGDIPMRQEFYIKGDLPTAKNRLYVSNKSPSETYSSHVTLKGVTPEGATLNLSSDETNAEIEIPKKNQFIWKIKNIQELEEKRYLNVKLNQQDYVVRYDIVHGKPFNVSLIAQYQTPSALIYAHANLQWWIENLFSLNSSWSHLHWGLSMSRQQHFTESDSQPKIDFTTFELLWRANEGFNLVNETWGLGLPIQLIQSESLSTTGQGLSWFWIKKADRAWLSRFSDWTELKASYFFSSTGDLKLKSAVQLKTMAYLQINPGLYAHYGINLDDYKFDPAANNEQSQLGLDIGLLWNF